MIDVVSAMNQSKELCIGVIGLGNQFKKIKNILYRKGIISREEQVRDLGRSQSEVRNNLETERPDIVFITCPNIYHIEYLHTLIESDRKCSIYIDKPVINSKADLARLIKLKEKSRQIFVGLNLRYSPIHRLIRRISDTYDLGKLISTSIRVAYPYALSNHYLESWKSSTDICPLGVGENLGIHFIDLSLQMHSSTPSSFKSYLSGRDNLRNTIFSSMIQYKNGSTSQIYCSYLEQAECSIRLSFSNGVCTFEKTTCVFPSVINIDKSGLNTTPKPLVITNQSLNNLLYKSSLELSISNFIAGLNIYKEEDTSQSFWHQTVSSHRILVNCNILENDD